MSSDIAQEVMGNLFQKLVGEEIANLGVKYVNGVENTLEPVRKIIEDYQVF